MDTVRWGIVGAGRIAHTLAQDMRATACGRVQAVAARNGDAAERFAQQYDIATFHEGYDALYADLDVDVVYVATPHNLHLQHAADALRAGKAVMCEKPLTINAGEAQALIDVARHSDGYLMEAMWTWFLPAVRQAQAWVREGRIGKLVRIHADFGYPQEYDANKREYDASLAGGCLLEMGVYPVALTALFCADAPQDFAVAARRAPNGVEDDLVATLTFADCIATLGTSFRAKLRNWAYIIGEGGYIAIPDFWRATECQHWQLDTMVERFVDDRDTGGFSFQIDAVNADVIAGRKESPTIPLSASLRVQMLMDEIRARFQG
ncbi:MAG: Gfo/Idh/MocA family oxidoreductase [Pseudomonadota bacterium]